jgi:hypothetical protein
VFVRRDWNEADVRRAVASARSLSETLRALGFRSHGGNHATLKRYIAQWGISTDHFDPCWAQRLERMRAGPQPLEDILVEGSTFHRNHLKTRLFKEGVKARACEMCGQGEQWRGRRMALILDHVNGMPDDHRLENLRILCPNCAATLDTHCGRKNATRLAAQTCPICAKEFAPRNRGQRFCSRSCAGRSISAHQRGQPKPALRKVDRPGCDQLFAEVDANGYLATGRQYGVSDNAVRKWVRQYEWELWEWSNSLPAEGPWDV